MLFLRGSAGHSLLWPSYSWATSEIDFILPVSDLHLQVDPWATLALSPGARRNVAKGTIVKSATHYKSRTNKKHEKLLIVLQTPHAGTITYMVTDRGPDPDEMETRRNEHSSMSLSPVGLSGDIWANDRIFIPGTPRFQSRERYKKQAIPFALHRSPERPDVTRSAGCFIASGLPTLRPLSTVDISMLLACVYSLGDSAQGV
jgi:hypothetical protein